MKAVILFAIIAITAVIIPTINGEGPGSAFPSLSLEDLVPWMHDALLSLHSTFFDKAPTIDGEGLASRALTLDELVPFIHDTMATLRSTFDAKTPTS